MAYQTFEHTADVGVRGIGKTFEEALQEAAKAMFSVMLNIKKVKPAKSVKVEVDIKGLDKSQILVEWLNRLVAEKDISMMAFSKFKVQIKGNKLIGTAWGEKFDPKKHESEVEVKAATYSQLKVGKKNNKWVVQCIVDV